LRRLQLVLLLRDQHQNVLLHGLLPLQSQELLLQSGMLQELLLLAGSVLQLPFELLQVRPLRLL